jgi:FkbM family methyltransferase
MREFARKIETRVRQQLFGGAARELYRSAVQQNNNSYVRYGSEYGGWYLPRGLNLTRDDIVFSAGAGEDISFDLELLRAYSPKVIVIVDPTPRAVMHYEALMLSLTSGATTHDFLGGTYDLRGIDHARLTYEAAALWSDEGSVSFWEPWNPEHVSYSIVNFQQATGREISVPSTRLKTLVAKYGCVPKVLKLDIEGAETEVVTDMLACGIHPDLLAIEYDELGFPNATTTGKIIACHRALLDVGYRLLHFDGHNALYEAPTSGATEA